MRHPRRAAQFGARGSQHPVRVIDLAMFKPAKHKDNQQTRCQQFSNVFASFVAGFMPAVRVPEHAAPGERGVKCSSSRGIQPIPAVLAGAGLGVQEPARIPGPVLRRGGE